MTYRRTRVSTVIFCIALFVFFASLSASAAEFRRTFLLEVGARYEVSVRIRTDIENAPTLASVYIHTDKGEYLRSTQLSRSIAGANQWQEISVVVTAPPNAQKATVVFSTPEGVEMEWDDVNIRRVELDMESDELIRQGLVYTGLIVDARGLGLQRGMSPRIYSESGRLIYAGVAASLDFVQESGIASYGQELTPELLRRLQPGKDPINVSPLVVEALEVTDSTETGVIISDADADAIIAALNTYDFLAEYSVIFLID